MSELETIRWETNEPHANNEETMSDYLENINMLDITLVDGTYAEGVNCKGEKFGIHAGGDGDFTHHKIDFETLSGDER